MAIATKLFGRGDAYEVLKGKSPNVSPPLMQGIQLSRSTRVPSLPVVQMKEETVGSLPRASAIGRHIPGGSRQTRKNILRKRYM